MSKELFRNAEGYVDITAYLAMKNFDKERKNKMEFLKGDLFTYNINGEEKMALVVSSDIRKTDKYINVIVLNDEPKGMLYFSVTTPSGIKYADCGMVSFSLTTRMGNFLKSISFDEMKRIDEGILQMLGLDYLQKEKVVEKPIEVIKGGSETCAAELAQAQAEAKVYKEMYEKLLEKVMGD